MKRYKETLLLPKTAFPMKVRPQGEEPIQKNWDQSGLYDRLIRARKGNPKVFVHDGPPYANGNLHFGHLFNKVLKDIVVRWQITKGNESQFIPGWDCHGLPIEHAVMNNDPKAQTLPATEIRSMCADVANHWVGVQRDQFKRLGILGEWNDPYLTTNPQYERCVLEVLETLVETGRVTRREKPIAWCAHDKTALAEAELEYKDVDSDAVYVAFPAYASFPGTKEEFQFLAWTTTPWTLPANVALAVNPNLRYCLVLIVTEWYVVAEDLLPDLLLKINMPAKIIATVDGRELEGMEYDPPFSTTLGGARYKGKVILADFVSNESGTGVVHIAPGHGVDDYNAVRAFNQSGKGNLPVVCPVDEDGRYYPGIHPELDGLLVTRKDTTEVIIKLLDRLVVHRHKYTHSYPHCWRCKRPTITRATPQWFVDMQHMDLRGSTLGVIQKIGWVPPAARNRIESMVGGRPDWCISRQRNWGIEIPSMECEDCGHAFMTSDTIHLRIDAGSDWWQSTRKINRDGFACPRCKSTNLLLGRDILDVWFESGSSHYAVVPEKTDQIIVIEGTDQHRGWFQSSLLLGTALGIKPFDVALTHGFIVDQNGRKLSKSEDAPAVTDTLDEYGADPVRLLVAMADYTDDLKLFDRKGKTYSIKGIKEATDAYNKIRNTFRFILGNLRDQVPHYVREVPQLQPVDQYIIHRLGELVSEVADAYDGFQFYRAYHAVYNFCVVDLSSVYFDVVKDRLYNDTEESDSGRAARWTLTETFYSLARLINPILPHLAAEVWSFTPHDDVDLFQVPVPTGQTFDVSKDVWDVLFKVRQHVLVSLEEKRETKLIGSALDAMVTIETNDPVLEANQEILRDLCLVSSLVTKPLQFGTGYTYRVTPIKAQPKCERCWQHLQNLNDHGLCGRCHAAVLVHAAKTGFPYPPEPAGDHRGTPL